MYKLIVILLAFVFSLILTGCAEKMDEIKVAVSGIDAVADKAAEAISIDVISIREIEIEHNDEVFTVNDLFKTILRDVQWEYEKKEHIHIFTVKGTWKDSLFENYRFTEVQKRDLSERGKVLVELQLVDGKIEPKATKVKMTLDKKTIVEESGIEALNYLYEYYTTQ